MKKKAGCGFDIFYEWITFFGHSREVLDILA